MQRRYWMPDAELILFKVAVEMPDAGLIYSKSLLGMPDAGWRKNPFWKVLWTGWQEV